MTTLKGIYQNGQIKLEKEFSSDKPLEVIVTFLQEPIEKSDLEEKYLKWEVFGFDKAQEILKDFKGSLSDDVIEERRSYL
jgi:hypothetical protein